MTNTGAGGGASSIIDGNLFAFTVGARQLALDCAVVRDIERCISSIDFPGAAVHMIGHTDFEGRTVPVVDLRVAFAQEARFDARTAVLFIAYEAAIVGIVVDAAVGLVSGAAGGSADELLPVLENILVLADIERLLLENASASALATKPAPPARPIAAPIALPRPLFYRHPRAQRQACRARPSRVTFSN
jgi:hypothetical protein